MTALLALTFLLSCMSVLIVRAVRDARAHPDARSARQDSRSSTGRQRPDRLPVDPAAGAGIPAGNTTRPPLEPLDGRCDSCPAAAVVGVRLPRGAALVLCGHHGRQYAGALRERGAVLTGDLSFAVTSRTPALT